MMAFAAPPFVIPAKAGIHLDPRFRGGDGKREGVGQ